MIYSKPMSSDILTPIVFYKDLSDKDPQQMSDCTWGVLCETLTNSEYIEESPCTIEDGPKKCAGTNCPYKSHSTLPDNPMGWSPVEIEGKRSNSNVKFVTLLTFDFDHLNTESAKQIFDVLAEYEHIKYTSHQNCLEDLRFRVVMLLSRKVANNQWRRFWSIAVQYLKFSAEPDPACKDPARMYFRPSHPKDAPFDAVRVCGKILDVDEVLVWGNNNFPEQQTSLAELETVALPEVPDWDLSGQTITEAIDLAARYFPAEDRNRICMYYAGMLRRVGASRSDAKFVVYEIARQGGSDNPNERSKTVDHTYDLSETAPMTGFTSIANKIGEDVAREFGDLIREARDEAFLRDIRANNKQSVTNGTHVDKSNTNGAVAVTSPALPVVIDLSVIRQLVKNLAAKRARSFDRDECISAIILRRVLDGKPIGTLDGTGDVETVKNGAEKGVPIEEAVRSVVGTLAFVLPANTPWEGVAEILRESLTSTPGDNWMVKAERAYKRSQTTRAVKEIEHANEQAEYQERIRVSLTTGSGNGSSPSSPPDGPGWRDGLTKGANGAVAPIYHNARVILKNHPDFCGYIRWNEISKTIEVHGGPMARYSKRGLENIVTGIHDYLASAHGLVLSSSRELGKRVAAVAQDNAYDPLKDYLNGLQWDGVSRATGWLKSYCGATEQPDSYLHKVGRRWLIALVARGLKPGCKVDNVLVLESKPGTGKSTVFDILGGPFFCDTAIDITNKDAQMTAGRYWICEMAEIVAFKKSGHDALKSFFSSRVDKFRPPYEATLQESPRRCLWVGTTNEFAYLGDETGNRKYWPVSCIYTPGATDALIRDRDQLIAEAVVAYKAGEIWHFDYNEQGVTEEEAEKRMIETPTKMQVSAWWYGLEKERRPRDGITTMQVAIDALGCFPSQLVNQSSVLMQIGHALKKMGFERRRDSNGKKREWKYYATVELLNVDVESKRKSFNIVGPVGLQVAR